MNVASFGKHYIRVLNPILICCIHVCLLTALINYSTNEESSDILVRGLGKLGLGAVDDESDSFKRMLGGNIIIVVCFISIIILLTMILWFIFYMRWHKCLEYYFYLPSLLNMILFSPIIIRQVLLAQTKFCVDLITITITIWNFVALGMISIFYIYVKAPTCLRHTYLIHNSAIFSVILIFVLPYWAAWILLGCLVIWDVLAILPDFGPLKRVLDMAKNEGVSSMAGLIYTIESDDSKSGEASEGSAKEINKNVAKEDTTAQAENKKDTTTTRERPDNQVGETKDLDDKDKSTITNNQSSNMTNCPCPSEPKEQAYKSGDSIGNQIRVDLDNESTLNIGLGDFIFFSLLVGLTFKEGLYHDHYATLASFLAIAIGLLLTMLLLIFTTKDTIPALPIPLALGILISHATMNLVPEVSNGLAIKQLFV